MDAPSKYFFGHKKKNGQKRLIHALHSEDGNLLSNPRQMREVTMRFYQSLYRSELEQEKREQSPFLEDLPKSSEESNEELGCGLTLGELYKTQEIWSLGKLRV